MKYAIPLTAAVLLLGAAAGETPSAASPPPCKHFVWGAHGSRPSPQAPCLQQTEADAGAVRADVALTRWSEVDRNITAFVSDEHLVEMDMPASPTLSEQRALTNVRRAVFTLVTAGAARDGVRTRQAAGRVLAACLPLVPALASPDAPMPTQGGLP